MSPDSPIQLSVVIPAYAEEERLRDSLPRIRAHLASQPRPWEIVVVDDGSPDRTSQVAEEALAGVAHTVLRSEPNAGKGASIRRGMLAARGQWVLFSDADLSTPIEEVEKFWPHLEEGAEVVIGSRALRESDLIVRQPWYRETMGRVFNLMVRALVIPGIADTQCGFKMFTRRAADLIFTHQTLDGFAFDVEVLGLARLAGLKICEVPVRWENSPASRVSAVGDSCKMFLDLLRVRRRLRRLRREGTLTPSVTEGGSP